MTPLIADMISATVSPEVGKMIANAPLGEKPFDPELPITPRENMELLLQHKKPRYLPIGGDTYPIIPDIVCERSYNNVTGPDWFGALWTFEPNIGATIVKPGTEMMDSLEGWQDKFKFPDLDALDWEESAKGLSKSYDPNRMSDWWVSIGLFERLHSTLGMQNALESLIVDEDLVAEFFDAITDYKIKLIKKLTSHYKVDMICFHDDWGFNKDGFIPPEIFKRLIVPNMKKIVDAVHDGGAYFNMHSDGKIERYIPFMVELGMDMWNPAQTVNDLEMIKREYGSKLVINGGMDEGWVNGNDIPEEKLREFARHKVDTLGAGGGFIASASTFNMRNKGIITDELKKYGKHFYE
ncbi:MAG: uroporphyrinogen decarboxylase family protein, partial [Oscillospiraceae bacterium]